MSARAYTFQKRRNGIVTTYTDHWCFYQVVLHNTTVFTQHSDRSITLNSGGWRTATTKTAINRAFDLLHIPARVWQKNFEWFVTYDGATFPFEDGMKLAGRLYSFINKLGVSDDQF